MISNPKVAKMAFNLATWQNTIFKVYQEHHLFIQGTVVTTFKNNICMLLKALRSCFL